MNDTPILNEGAIESADAPVMRMEEKKTGIYALIGLVLIVLAGAGFALYQMHQQIVQLRQAQRDLPALMDGQQKLESRVTAIYDRLDELQNANSPETLSAIKNDLAQIKESKNVSEGDMAFALFEQAVVSGMPFDGALSLALRHAPDAAKAQLQNLQSVAAQGLKSRAALIQDYYAKSTKTQPSFLPSWLAHWISIKPSARQAGQSDDLQSLIAQSNGTALLDLWREQARARIAADAALDLWRANRKAS